MIDFFILLLVIAFFTLMTWGMDFGLTAALMVFHKNKEETIFRIPALFILLGLFNTVIFGGIAIDIGTRNDSDAFVLIFLLLLFFPAWGNGIYLMLLGLRVRFEFLEDRLRYTPIVGRRKEYYYRDISGMKQGFLGRDQFFVSGKKVFTVWNYRSLQEKLKTVLPEHIFYESRAIQQRKRIVNGVITCRSNAVAYLGVLFILSLGIFVLIAAIYVDFIEISFTGVGGTALVLGNFLFAVSFTINIICYRIVLDLREGTISIRKYRKTSVYSLHEIQAIKQVSKGNVYGIDLYKDGVKQMRLPTQVTNKDLLVEVLCED